MRSLNTPTPLAALALILAFALTGCEPSTGVPEEKSEPEVPEPGGSDFVCEPEEIVIERIDDEPFRWYGDEQVSLDPDSTQLVVEVTPEAPIEVARSALEETGLGVVSTTGFTNGPWRLVTLDPATTLSQARAGAEAIRGDDRFPFVSLAYRDPDGFTSLPVNRLVVRFHDDVEEVEVECLVENAGMSIDRGAPTYYLTYAPGAEPLSVANYFQTLPLTRWAEADRVCQNCSP